MNKEEKVGGALIASLGFFFMLTHYTASNDVLPELSAETAAGGGSDIIESENSDESGVGQIAGSVGATSDRGASALSGGSFGDLQKQPNSSEEQIHIGSFIDPDRGEDFSVETIPVHIGDYIDPDRGPDLSDRPPVHIGEYMDPDAEGIETSDPLDVMRIGEFIDPDGEGTTAPGKRIEIFTKASGVLPE